MIRDDRPRILNGFVSNARRPEVVRGPGDVLELRFLLGVNRWKDGGRTHDGVDYHHVVLRDDGSNMAVAYANVLQPGRRLHVHGLWRTRTDGDETVHELVTGRLYQPLPIPEGTRHGVPATKETP